MLRLPPSMKMRRARISLSGSVGENRRNVSIAWAAPTILVSGELSKKIVVPRNLTIDAFHVRRGTNHLALHLLRNGRKGDPGIEVFRFTFVPWPRFT